MKKLSNDMVDSRLLLNNKLIKRIGNYSGIYCKITFQCLNINCGEKWEATPNNILNNTRGCPFCHPTSKYTNKKIDIKLAGRSIKRIGDIGTNNSNFKLKFQCLIETCNHIWEVALKQVISDRKSGCPECAIREQRLTNDEFDFKIKSNGFTRLENYTTAITAIKVKCNTCSHVWTLLPASVKNGQGCPICPRKNEKIVLEILNKHFKVNHNFKLKKINDTFAGRHNFDAYIILYNII